MSDITIAQGELAKTYEDALLGFIAMDPNKMLEVSEILTSPDYFSDPNNRATYEIYLRLFHEDRFPGSPMLLISELYNGIDGKKHFESQDATMRYVNALINSSTTKADKFKPSAYVEYAEYIKWEKDKRDIQSVGAEMISASEKVGVNEKEEFLSGIEDSISDITMRVHGKDSLKHISDITCGISEQLDKLRRGEVLSGGTPTGIDMLDKTLNGMNEGELIVLAARPGVGKSTLSMQIACNVSQTMTQGKPNAVLLFSLEMLEDQIMSRLIANAGRLNMEQFVKDYKQLNDDHYYAKTYSKSFEDKMKRKLDVQMDRALLALKHVENLPIYTSTEFGMSPNSIKSLAMQKKREIEKKGENLSLIVIDYLQLMTSNMSKTNASRTEEVGDMSRKMKALAKEFQVPVLLLAQLNRNASASECPRPQDLRESGSIEQDADKIIFIWSENAEKTPSDFPEYTEDAARAEAWRREQMKVTITVAKNRSGETGDCPVIFDKGFQTFVSQSNEYAANNEQYAEFAAKYYQKTRTTDLFWPLKEGEVPEELERFRSPTVREVPYLTPDGQLITLGNDGDNVKGKMTIQSNVITTSNQDVAPAREKAAAAQTDRSGPAALPVIDDLESDFEELPEDDAAEQISAETEAVPVAQNQPVSDAANNDGSADSGSAPTEEAVEAEIVMDGNKDDDDMIDLDDLDMLEALSQELEN